MKNKALIFLSGVLGACLLLSTTTWALEFRSIAANATIMYDAPSLKANRLFIASQYYPVEVVVSLEHWAKVRDISGDLTWVEKEKLSEKRTVMVNVPLADIMQAPDSKSPLAFQAEQRVALELLEFSTPGWVKVRHRDGQNGYIPISQVWGI
ncbi:SH3 domain-containing protein [Sulfurirhabdus autotrophica]|uniref:SH3 domain-containing protein n=1 Tax=Sulfurirhabdus autotrophica TaxID=1706046 RepID=A0A4R3Y0L9_9PROT|nr:SH3 domain-containing protein [Sulfurirhabdus autotrophica]TCV85206.1 SH3 domain-containing protein [Sulfurirhabdus autotrophica]